MSLDSTTVFGIYKNGDGTPKAKGVVTFKREAILFSDGDTMPGDEFDVIADNNGRYETPLASKDGETVAWQVAFDNKEGSRKFNGLAVPYSATPLEIGDLFVPSSEDLANINSAINAMAVRYDTEQDLTDEQKFRARTNISAPSFDDLPAGFQGFQQSEGLPSAPFFPNNGDWGFYHDSDGGGYYIVYGLGSGAIKTWQSD